MQRSVDQRLAAAAGVAEEYADQAALPLHAGRYIALIELASFIQFLHRSGISVDRRKRDRRLAPDRGPQIVFDGGEHAPSSDRVGRMIRPFSKRQPALPVSTKFQ